MKLQHNTKVQLKKDGVSYWVGTFSKYAKRIREIDNIIAGLEKSGRVFLGGGITLELA